MYMGELVLKELTMLTYYVNNGLQKIAQQYFTNNFKFVFKLHDTDIYD